LLFLLKVLFVHSQNVVGTDQCDKLAKAAFDAYKKQDYVNALQQFNNITNKGCSFIGYDPDDIIRAMKDCENKINQSVPSPQQTSTTPKIKLSSNSIVLKSDGESKSIIVSCSGGTGDWVYDYEPKSSWIDIKRSTHDLTIIASSNTTKKSRECKVTITYSGVTKNFTVKQSAPESPKVTVSPPSFEFPDSGGEHSFTVKCKRGNNDCSVRYNLKQGNAQENHFTLTYTSNGFKISAKKNSKTNVEKCTIEMWVDDEVIKTIPITQNGRPASTLSVSPSSLTFDYKGKSTTLRVTSNDTWKIISKPAWVNLISNNNSVTITCSQNSGYRRGGHIEIKTEDGKKNVQIPIIQERAPIILTKDIFYIEDTETTQYIPVDCIGEYSVVAPSWIYVQEKTAQSLKLRIAANPDFENRKGVVKVQFGDYEQKFTIIQERKEVFIKLEPAYVYFSYKGGSQYIRVKTNYPYWGVYYKQGKDSSHCNYVVDRINKDKFTINVKKNMRYQPREIYLQVESSKQGKTSELHIVQDAHPNIEQKLGNKGGLFSIVHLNNDLVVNGGMLGYAKQWGAYVDLGCSFENDYSPLYNLHSYKKEFQYGVGAMCGIAHKFLYLYGGISLRQQKYHITPQTIEVETSYGVDIQDFIYEKQYNLYGGELGVMLRVWRFLFSAGALYDSQLRYKVGFGLLF